MKRIGLGVFESARAANSNKFALAHPESRHHEYTDLAFWVEMAQLLDDAAFDFLFFADGYGYPIDARGDVLPAAVEGGSFSGLESMTLIPALAHVTQRLGLVFTSPTGLDHPVHTARRLASLDHLTRGRLGWNVVTGSSQDAIALLFGHEQMRAHDDRYARAREYLEMTLELWEGSWDDDGVLADRTRGVYADPGKIHRIDRAGEFYRTSGYLTVEPSPQRTPVIFQAGTSEVGKDFAARYAECVFVKSESLERTAESVADIRERAARYGREPGDIAMFCSASIIAGPDRDEALSWRKSIVDLQTDEGAASQFRALAGIDLMALDPALPLTQRGDDLGEMNQSDVRKYLPRAGERAMTVREILDDLKGAKLGDWTITGDGGDVVDAMEEIVAATDIDGFMLQPSLDIAELRRFVTFVLPVMQSRGHRPEGPSPARTFRAGLSGGDRLKPSHPGASYRRLAAPA
ncbi:NtaA/DmoA family FMN-dependent monooxygenase [Microbacterium limosum]|uniref:NtaA/DmoA family FMN-dependent monooxygenase n=1 Tax=Microbacterium limosum TaxID=3079935 RepID=A0AAU0MGX6_9MICO|nr:NtaA/DmoA family FMN-dependent monooxygenase [Microbacterium sp. Y20]WOQ69435.1 NtaA/DmoA family FMN-dependent monooxygenase [Microbacterium sp. Y20]